MKNIKFIEQTTSTYGRGKDKNKRKKRAITVVGAALTSIALGAREVYKKLKNRRTVKIGKKTLVYNPPT